MGVRGFGLEKIAGQWIGLRADSDACLSYTPVAAGHENWLSKPTAWEAEQWRQTMVGGPVRDEFVVVDLDSGELIYEGDSRLTPPETPSSPLGGLSPEQPPAQPQPRKHSPCIDIKDAPVGSTVSINHYGVFGRYRVVAQRRHFTELACLTNGVTIMVRRYTLAEVLDDQPATQDEG